MIYSHYAKLLTICTFTLRIINIFAMKFFCKKVSSVVKQCF